jgi:hypothetical protein
MSELSGVVKNGFTGVVDTNEEFFSGVVDTGEAL